jgi:hypothetical protein
MKLHLALLILVLCTCVGSSHSIDFFSLFFSKDKSNDHKHDQLENNDHTGEDIHSSGSFLGKLNSIKKDFNDAKDFLKGLKNVLNPLVAIF